MQLMPLKSIRSYHRHLRKSISLFQTYQYSLKYYIESAEMIKEYIDKLYTVHNYTQTFD